MPNPLVDPIARYTRWLHTGWPAGTVERLPAISERGGTRIPGVIVVGDLTGIPLLKFAADSGARAVARIASDPEFASRRRSATPGVVDVAIVGAGVSGMAAAIEARRLGLDVVVIESSEAFSTVVNFPKRKPIFTYPTGMVPAGALQVTAAVKEPLVEELTQQAREAGIVPRPGRAESVRRSGDALEVVLRGEAPLRAHRVIVAIGRSGNFRRLGVPGESLDKVSNRLHDPADFAGKEVLVVGGGDAAVETAVAIARAGGRVTLSCRSEALTRPKPENVEAARALPGRLRLALGTRVGEIREREVVLEAAGGGREILPNDAVFTMIGREAPLAFFRRSGLPIRGEWTARTWVGLVAILAFCVFLYNWKASGELYELFKARHWFPFGMTSLLVLVAPSLGRPSSLLGTLALSLASPGFYYSLAYCACVVAFGVKRIARRKTPYVRLQTLTLMAIQVVPLFLLPYVILPWMGHNGAFDAGLGKWIGDQLFPPTRWDVQGREYWRAFGLVLAWPLFIWNVFTSRPMALWLAISAFQTFVAIPLLVWRWGKGAYCGWICSCGALAETLGDAHREKMPHGPFWNRLNMLGQAVLAAALLLFVLRVASWIAPGGVAQALFDGMLSGWRPLGIQTNYYWIVDVGLAGILGVGLYFHLSGRTWCRFACPLAALMHVYARFSSFRILADKKRCISCNVCTSVCHQGIDVMSFANKGLPMEDPQCVRCSACVASCPTGVLSFGRVDRSGAIVSVEALRATLPK